MGRFVADPGEQGEPQKHGLSPPGTICVVFSQPRLQVALVDGSRAEPARRGAVGIQREHLGKVVRVPRRRPARIGKAVEGFVWDARAVPGNDFPDFRQPKILQLVTVVAVISGVYRDQFYPASRLFHLGAQVEPAFGVAFVDYQDGPGGPVLDQRAKEAAVAEEPGVLKVQGHGRQVCYVCNLVRDAGLSASGRSHYAHVGAGISSQERSPGPLDKIPLRPAHDELGIHSGLDGRPVGVVDKAECGGPL